MNSMEPNTLTKHKMIVRKASAKKEDVPVFLMKVSVLNSPSIVAVAFGGIGWSAEEK